MTTSVEPQLTGKQLSPAALLALQEALSSIYWYKKQLRSFLSFSLSDSQILSLLNWEDNKRNIVASLVELLINNSQTDDLIKICYHICQLTDFSHLSDLVDGALKVKQARQSVEQLKSLINPHEEHRKERDHIAERNKIAEEKRQKIEGLSRKINEIKSSFIELSNTNNAQQKGFKLETIMYDLFKVFDLDPKASFKNKGEQIDGAFTLDNTDYLFEAKWQQKPVDRLALAGFSAKVTAKLENTLGLFLSINGFSAEGIEAHQSNRSSILLMDGTDLMAALEQRIDFQELLRRKRRHASQTGEVFLPFSKIASSAY